MSTTSSSVAGDQMELESLIQSLPACKRCRDCRRGCDTFLPKCRQCTKAGVECIYHDHGRDKYLSRSYIAELVDHVRRISARNNPSPAASSGTPQEAASAAPAASAVSVKAESVASTAPEAHQHYEHYFASAGNSYRYLGSESCLIRSPRLQGLTLSVPLEEDDDDYLLSFSQTPAKSYEMVEVYLESIQPLYPILDTSARYLLRQLPSELTEVELFNLNMVYSIACHVMPVTTRRRHPHHQWNPSGKLSYHTGNYIKYRERAGTFLARAMEHLEASTAEPTIDTLRAILLLAINSLFDPKTGNIGQQVALATRLALTLESKIEQQELSPIETEMLRNMHSTIFSIENELASTLDRPATFPEPNWEISFNPERPADYICSLYRLQHRYRKSDAVGKETVKTHLPLLDQKSELIPGLRMALHQTHLVLNPKWGSAYYVLEAVVSSGCVHNFLTPHWVYRAGTILIQNMPHILPGNLVQLYSNALIVLELSSWKWGSSAALSASLSETMQAMIAKVQPEWQGTVTHYDIRQPPQPQPQPHPQPQPQA
ncbi:hypothetical protein P280DRAFT_474515 [Massarina eburnea CBS 473.64]|uniref:Zn(2)-C6 fungal-type domain-containing protein n=1 Tax=Massarina eburnea CBS 473.64 TaxID=1395130 RepID=A0A6A6RHD8_9PLEO|nr:hypothetical protein P280DRAFT_474515 [Massarina eburnea CBS 473.64]